MAYQLWLQQQQREIPKVCGLDLALLSHSCNKNVTPELCLSKVVLFLNLRIALASTGRNCSYQNTSRKLGITMLSGWLFSQYVTRTWGDSKQWAILQLFIQKMLTQIARPLVFVLCAMVVFICKNVQERIAISVTWFQLDVNQLLKDVHLWMRLCDSHVISSCSMLVLTSQYRKFVHAKADFLKLRNRLV